MLATLEDLKGKLDLPASDDSRNAALTMTLEAASDRVFALARYIEADETDREDTLLRVRTGATVYLPKRPVAEITLVEGRLLGGDFLELAYDLVDDEQGQLVILGASPLWPRAELPPRMRRWPVVRVTYDVTGIGDEVSAPADLRDTVAAWAAYLYDRHLAGAAKDVALGPIRKVLLSDAMPEWVASALVPHTEGRRARWV